MTAVGSACGGVAPDDPDSPGASHTVSTPSSTGDPALQPADPSSQSSPHHAAEQTLAGRYHNLIDIKFREPSGVRLKHGQWYVEPSRCRAPSKWRPSLRAVREIVDRVPKNAVQRMAPFTPAYHDEQERLGEANTGRDVPNMNLWYRLYVDGLDDAGLLELVRDLRSQRVVQFVEPTPQIGDGSGRVQPDRAPWPTGEQLRASEHGEEPPIVRPREPLVSRLRKLREILGTGLPPTNPPSEIQDWEKEPRYLQFCYPNGYGVGILALRRRFVNSRGLDAQFADVEYGWNLDHEEFPWDASQRSKLLVNGEPIWTNRKNDHGTAVLGIIAAQENGWGTAGMAPHVSPGGFSDSVYLSTVHPASTGVQNLLAAINKAVATIKARDPNGKGRGGVLLLELGIPKDFNGDGKADSWETAPLAQAPAYRDAIKSAVDAGIIVVVGAGNGGIDLETTYPDIWNPDSTSYADTGAVMVGAGVEAPPERAGYSNHGRVVDVNAGVQQVHTANNVDKDTHNGVLTTGKNDYPTSNHVTDPNFFFSNSFNGTSAASAVIAGALTAFTGVSRMYYGADLRPKEIREVLRLTGSDAWAGQGIGRRADIADWIAYLENRHLQVGSTDWNGDGRADYIVWGGADSTPGSGTWTVYDGDEAGIQLAHRAGGKAGDIPIPGHWTTSAHADLALFRCPILPSPGYNTASPCSWLVPTNHQYSGTVTYQSIASFGHAGDIPVPFDMHGDGILEPAVYRPFGNSTGSDLLNGRPAGVWYVEITIHPPEKSWSYGSWTFVWRPAPIKLVKTIDFGKPAATPLTGDFDGDGHTDLALVERDGKWHIRFYPYDEKVTADLNFYDKNFCTAGDIPRVWKSSGIDGIGCFDPATGKLHRRIYMGWAIAGRTDLESAASLDQDKLIPRLADTNGDGADELVFFDPLHDQSFHDAKDHYHVTTNAAVNAFGMIR